MTPQRWQQVNDLFDAAIELSPESRAEFLSRACGVDHELRRDVESLLEFDRKTDTMLSRPDESSAAAPSIGGRRIGPYRLLHILADGGMGTVWLAERADDEFRQQVAIKVIRPGLNTPETSRRFRTERQLLASLSHPNIARLLDGGVGDDGSPYFVMEYVDGAPIDRFCDDRALSIADRIKLFREVCSAVQFAHQSLVVHRDLKPGNVFVSTDGKPILLDFGIAKVLSPDDRAPPQHITIADQRPFTPAYASPEHLAGGIVTTASDIYSLGIMLYELLTGHHPFADRDSPSTVAAANASRDREPDRPSRAVLRDTSRCSGAHRVAVSARMLSAQRDSDPRKLASRLAGDLDNIVLKALQREPHDRYVSVEQLSEDLRRYLQGLPVLARRGTAVYRVRKFITRNAFLVAAVSLVSTTVVSLLIGLAVQSNALQQQRAIADAARSEAQMQAARSREAELRARGNLRLMLTFLASATGDSRSSALDRKKLLDDTTSRLEGEPFDDPSLEAEIRLAIARAYARERSPSAEHFFRTALDCYRRAGSSQTDALSAALLESAAYFAEIGKPTESETLLTECIGALRKTLGRAHPRTAEAISALAEVLTLESRFEEALAMLSPLRTDENALTGLPADLQTRIRIAALDASIPLDPRAARSEVNEILSAERTRHDVESPAATAMLLRVARCALGVSDRPAALSAAESATETLRKALPSDDLRIAAAMALLGDALRESGQLDRAQTQYVTALGIYRDRALLDHPARVDCLLGYAQLLEQRGDVSSAERQCREAVESASRCLGERSLLAAAAFEQLGRLQIGRGEFASAEPVLRTVLEIRRERLGASHKLVAAALSSLASLYEKKQEWDSVLPLAREHVKILAELAGPDSPEPLFARLRLSSVLASSGRIDEAGAEVRATLESIDRALAADRPLAAAVCRSLRAALDSGHSFPTVIDAANDAIAFIAISPDDRQSSGPALHAIADRLRSMNDLTTAEQIAREFLAVANAEFDIHGEPSPDAHGQRATILDQRATALFTLGSVLLAQSRAIEAEPILREAFVARKSLTQVRHPGDHRVAEVEGAMGECLVAMGRTVEAERLLVSSWDHYRLAAPTQSFHEQRAALQRLIKLYDSLGKPDQRDQYADELAKLPQ